MVKRTEDDWFAPKRFGYGAGLPIAWQGWAVLVSYVAVVIGLGLLLPHVSVPERARLIVAQVLATVVMVVVAKRHTRGGWKWRSKVNRGRHSREGRDP